MAAFRARIVLAPTPRDAKVLAQAFSPDLAEIIRDINKYSNNTMAQQLFLSLGQKFRNDADGDDAKAAQRVVRQWLAKKGITAPHLVMENGSGLSRAERVSAREMASMLQAAWHSPYRRRVHQLDADCRHRRHHAQTPEDHRACAVKPTSRPAP